MEDQSMNNHFIICLVLIVAALFIGVDIMEIVKIWDGWTYALEYQSPIFETCYRYPLLTKAAFTVFSLFSALSGFLLIFLLYTNITLFAERLLTTYLMMNYILFGPYMLGFTISGLIYWDEIMYICDRDVPSIKIFSYSNMVNVMLCFTLALIITITRSIYDSINMYIDSIARREDGNLQLGKLFWRCVSIGNPARI